MEIPRAFIGPVNHWRAIRCLMMMAVGLAQANPPAQARVIQVPADYTTIQAALDAAANQGDEIVVSPGIYTETITILDKKNVNLHSIDPTSATVQATTIIDGDNIRDTVWINGDHDNTCRLAGFKIRNSKTIGISGDGHATSLMSGPILEYNAIVGNPYGGIYWVRGVIQNNRIEYNGSQSAGQFGHGGIDGCYNITIQNNIIAKNQAFFCSGINNCHGLIRHNTIYGNRSWFTSAAGIDCYDTGCIIVNNIVWANSNNKGWAQFGEYDNPNYCCIMGWPEPDHGGSSIGIGNISLDPKLVDVDLDDFHLQPDSPCIDNGGFIDGLNFDFENHLRPLVGGSAVRGDGTHFDMGAYESPGDPASPNQTPNQPKNTWPADGDTPQTYTPVLTASPFSDPNPGNILVSAQWQVASDPYLTSITLQSTLTSGEMTQLPLDFHQLSYGQRYFWHVRYQDQSTSWSEWSTPTSFIFPSAQPPARPTNVSPAKGQIVDVWTPTLGATPISIPYPPNEPNASQWQVDVEPGFAAPRFDSGTVNSYSAPITTYTLPSGILRLETTFWWRVRYRGAIGFWSDWSAPTSFTMSDVIPSDHWGTFFPPRYMGKCQVYQNKIWVLGPHDVWSSADGRAWKYRSALSSDIDTYNPRAASLADRMVLLDSRAGWFSASGTDWIRCNLTSPLQSGCAFDLVSFQNLLWRFSGTAVWSSSDGVNWTTMTLSAGYPPRTGAGVLGYRGRLWVIGGMGPDYGLLNDAWSSADGSVWRKEMTPPFGARLGFGCAVLNGRMWIIGGKKNGQYLSDVWSWSSSDPAWRNDTAAAPFAPRSDPGVVTFNGRLWVIAGSTVRPGHATTAPKNDVWSSADGKTWTRETGQTCIMDALDAATTGTEIIMPPGRYEEIITIDKDVTLRSQNPLDPAIVGQSWIQDSAIQFGGKETPACRLAGFSITGLANPVAGNGTNATISHNVFINNGVPQASVSMEDFPLGGALFRCDGLIDDNKFQGNTSLFGGAVGNCRGTIQNNLFIDNTCYDAQSYWMISWNPKSGATYVYVVVKGAGSAIDTDSGLIRNNTIVTHDRHSAIESADDAICMNNIVWSLGTGWDRSLISVYRDWDAINNCVNAISYAGPGNITLDPRFVDPANGDFHLRPDSPCIDAGAMAPSLTTDYDGNPRGVYGNYSQPSNGILMDIGAFEYIPLIHPLKNAITPGSWNQYR